MSIPRIPAASCREYNPHRYCHITILSLPNRRTFHYYFLAPELHFRYGCLKVKLSGSHKILNKSQFLGAPFDITSRRKSSVYYQPTTPVFKVYRIRDDTVMIDRDCAVPRCLKINLGSTVSERHRNLKTHVIDHLHCLMMAERTKRRVSPALLHLEVQLHSVQIGGVPYSDEQSHVRLRPWTRVDESLMAAINQHVVHVEHLAMCNVDVESVVNGGSKLIAFPLEASFVDGVQSMCLHSLRTSLPRQHWKLWATQMPITNLKVLSVSDIPTDFLFFLFTRIMRDGHRLQRVHLAFIDQSSWQASLELINMVQEFVEDINITMTIGAGTSHANVYNALQAAIDGGKLTRLDFAVRMRVNDDDIWQELIEFFETCKSLRTLRLFCDHQHVDQRTQLAIVNALPTCENLDDLALAQFLTIPADIALMRLKRLSLTSLPGLSEEDVFNLIRRNIQLESVELINMNIQEECLLKIANVVHITRIRIRGIHAISVDGWREMSSLEHLKLLDVGPVCNGGLAAAMKRARTKLAWNVMSATKMPYWSIVQYHGTRWDRLREWMRQRCELEYSCVELRRDAATARVCTNGCPMCMQENGVAQLVAEVGNGGGGRGMEINTKATTARRAVSYSQLPEA